MVPPVSGDGFRVRVNGRDETLSGSEVSIGSYLASKGVRPETVAVEVNLRIVARSDFDRTMIRPGDEVEIVRFVGGGAV